MLYAQPIKQDMEYEMIAVLDLALRFLWFQRMPRGPESQRCFLENRQSGGPLLTIPVVSVIA
jgi:hypothetical protein